MKALLANRFYYWDAEPESYKPENMNKTSCGCGKAPRLLNKEARHKPELAMLPNNNDAVEIPIPPCLEWYQLY